MNNARAIAAAIIALALTSNNSNARRGDEFAVVSGGTLRTVLPNDNKRSDVSVAKFSLARRPVTNAEFLTFVRKNAEWRRGQAAEIFVDQGYLQHWDNPLQLGASALANQPVTQVSWFAAQAFCEAQGMRLPTWHEWELAAAADEHVRDARSNPIWREKLLSWYARPTATALPAVGANAPNVYGIYDLHGLVWEWVEDFNALMVSGDNRKQGDPDLAKFCGAGALSVNDRENYPILMRVALLSSLQARYTTRNLGFRCAMNARQAKR